MVLIQLLAHQLQAVLALLCHPSLDLKRSHSADDAQEEHFSEMPEEQVQEPDESGIDHQEPSQTGLVDVEHVADVSVHDDDVPEESASLVALAAIQGHSESRDNVQEVHEHDAEEVVSDLQVATHVQVQPKGDEDEVDSQGQPSELIEHQQDEPSGKLAQEEQDALDEESAPDQHPYEKDGSDELHALEELDGSDEEHVPEGRDDSVQEHVIADADKPVATEVIVHADAVEQQDQESQQTGEKQVKPEEDQALDGSAGDVELQDESSTAALGQEQEPHDTVEQVQSQVPHQVVEKKKDDKEEQVQPVADEQAVELRPKVDEQQEKPIDQIVAKHVDVVSDELQQDATHSTGPLSDDSNKGQDVSVQVPAQVDALHQVDSKDQTIVAAPTSQEQEAVVQVQQQKDSEQDADAIEQEQTVAIAAQSIDTVADQQIHTSQQSTNALSSHEVAQGPTHSSSTEIKKPVIASEHQTAPPIVTELPPTIDEQTVQVPKPIEELSNATAQIDQQPIEFEAGDSIKPVPVEQNDQNADQLTTVQPKPAVTIQTIHQTIEKHSVVEAHVDGLLTGDNVQGHSDSSSVEHQPLQHNEQRIEEQQEVPLGDVIVESPDAQIQQEDSIASDQQDKKPEQHEANASVQPEEPQDQASTAPVQHQEQAQDSAPSGQHVQAVQAQDSASSGESEESQERPLSASAALEEQQLRRQEHQSSESLASSDSNESAQQAEPHSRHTTEELEAFYAELLQSKDSVSALSSSTVQADQQMTASVDNAQPIVSDNLAKVPEQQATSLPSATDSNQAVRQDIAQDVTDKAKTEDTSKKQSDTSAIGTTLEQAVASGTTVRHSATAARPTVDTARATEHVKLKDDLPRDQDDQGKDDADNVIAGMKVKAHFVTSDTGAASKADGVQLDSAADSKVKDGTAEEKVKTGDAKSKADDETSDVKSSAENAKKTSASNAPTKKGQPDEDSSTFMIVLISCLVVLVLAAAFVGWVFYHRKMKEREAKKTAVV